MTNIKLFATDVDGTMTDACMYYAENGIELKKFNFRDGMGFKLLRDAGIKTAIITSENTSIVWSEIIPTSSTIVLEYL